MTIVEGLRNMALEYPQGLNLEDSKILPSVLETAANMLENYSRKTIELEAKLSKERAEVKKLRSQVDTVKVVRCQDCKYYRSGLNIDGKPFTSCNGTDKSVRTYGHTEPDWYCANGERRENAE